MNDVGWMHKEEPSQDLIDKVLNVIVAEFLAREDDSVKVCLHEISDDVYVSVASPGFRLEDVEESNDIIVLKKLCISW